MSASTNPEDAIFSVEWQALQREAKLAAQLIGSGATALGRANYAAQGEYYVAFFGLTIGLERLAKLVLVVAHAIRTKGTMPTEAAIKKFGHRIDLLLDEAALVANEFQIQSKRPTDQITLAITEVLSAFATQERYANFRIFGGNQSPGVSEPLATWWQRVAIPILATHYSARQRQRDETNARIIGELLTPVAIVHHHAEDGRVLDNVEEASRLTGATAIVQKYGRFYVLRIVRWLSEIVHELCMLGAYRKRIGAIFGLDEHFGTYRVEDNFLRDRKNWPLT